MKLLSDFINNIAIFVYEYVEKPHLIVVWVLSFITLLVTAVDISDANANINVFHELRDSVKCDTNTLITIISPLVNGNVTIVSNLDTLGKTCQFPRGHPEDMIIKDVPSVSGVEIFFLILAVILVCWSSLMLMWGKPN